MKKEELIKFLESKGVECLLPSFENLKKLKDRFSKERLDISIFSTITGELIYINSFDKYSKIVSYPTKVYVNGLCIQPTILNTFTGERECMSDIISADSEDLDIAFNKGIIIIILSGELYEKDIEPLIEEFCSTNKNVLLDNSITRKESDVSKKAYLAVSML